MTCVATVTEKLRLFRAHSTNGITLSGGMGCTVWDAAGKQYLDLLSGTWCNVLGYRHPKWIAAIRRQVGDLVHIGAPFHSREVACALSRLREIIPPVLNRVIFLSSGSEAVELALRIAREATGRSTMVVNENGYYGATNHALAMSRAGWGSPSLPDPGSIHRLPSCSECSMNCMGLGPPFPCLDRLCHDLHAEKWEPAAFLYEPVIAGNGADVPPKGYGAELRRIASERGAVFIAEEITTGMGRTGTWFGFEHEEIAPDILVVGKALGAGYPVSAVITNSEVEAACPEAFRHVQSHQNDPLSAAVVSAVISIIEEEGLLKRITRIGNFFAAGLCEMRALAPWIRDVRGKGLMIAVQLEPREIIRGLAAHNALLAAGFILDYQAQTGTFRLFPPYVITESEINDFLTAFANVLTHT